MAGSTGAEEPVSVTQLNDANSSAVRPMEPHLTAKTELVGSQSDVEATTASEAEFYAAEDAEAEIVLREAASVPEPGSPGAAGANGGQNSSDLERQVAVVSHGGARLHGGVRQGMDQTFGVANHGEV